MGKQIDVSENNKNFDTIETVPVQEHVGTTDVPSFEFIEVKRFFDLPLYLSMEESKKVKEIADALISNGVKRENIGYELRRLERKIGGANIGESRLSKIWRFFRLLEKANISEGAKREVAFYAKHR